jgi:hypothetical protein
MSGIDVMSVGDILGGGGVSQADERRRTLKGWRLFLAGLAGPLLLSGPFAHAEPRLRAEIRGDLPADLRTRIEAAVGAIDRPARNRFDARQRANVAADEAAAVLRSEGYYDFRVRPNVSEGADAEPFVEVEIGPRFRIARPQIEWIDPAPPESLQVMAMGEAKIEPGSRLHRAPGRDCRPCRPYPQAHLPHQRGPAGPAGRTAAGGRRAHQA